MFENSNIESSPTHLARVKYTNVIIEECEVLVPVHSDDDHILSIINKAKESASQHIPLLKENPLELKFRSSDISFDLIGFGPFIDGEFIADNFYNLKE